MLELVLGLAAAVQAEPCAPRVNLTAGGPPPAILRAERLHSITQARMDLSVHRCREAGLLRVERHRSGAEPTSEWVTTRQCPDIGRWVGAAEALALAPGATAPLEDLGRPAAGLFYILSGRTATGGGLHGRLEVEVRQAEGAPLNALSAWVESGEQAFQRCRDGGLGDTRWLGPGGRR